MAYYVRFAHRFLGERFKQGGMNLACIRAADGTGFIQHRAHRHSPGYAKLLVTSLRSFFRHLQHRGAIATDLGACVPTVPSWSFAALPKFLPVGMVQRVLKNCDRQTSLGRRDYAILLLLARLGLRACEVASLNLEDIDWDTGQIRVWRLCLMKHRHHIQYKRTGLRTLAWALFNESYSLKAVCEALNTKNRKIDLEPSGKVTIEDLEYGRHDDVAPWKS